MENKEKQQTPQISQNVEIKKKEVDIEIIAQVIIVALLIVLIIYKFNSGGVAGVSGTGAVIGVGGGETVSLSEIIPKGIPAIYGKELGVSYDDVSPNNQQLADATIQKLTASEDLTLNKEQMKRYIIIGSSIACEYCCGAKSLIFSNGERACGCAHSYAMRGLAKYLLTKHPEMSDNNILSELGKWKVLFFPGIHEQKAKVLKSKGIDEKDYINLASNKYRGIEQGQASGGGMVGGC